MRHYTKQQKQEYFKNLRNRWNEAKKIADSHFSYADNGMI